MEKERKSGRMAVNMKEIFTKVKLRIWDTLQILKMDLSTLANGKMTKLMDKVS